MSRRTLALAVAGCNLGLLVVAAVLFALTLDVPWSGWGPRGANGATAVAVLALAVLLAIRRPQNPIGWLLLAASTFFGVDEIGVHLDMLLRERGQALTGPVAGLLEASWVPGMVLLLHGFARFPDGRLPDGRMGRAVSVLGPLAVVTTGAAMMLDAGLGAVPSTPATEARGILLLPMPLFAGTVLATIATRFRAATGVRRQQFRWVAYAAIPFVLGFVLLPIALAGPVPPEPQAVLIETGAILNVGGGALLLGAVAVAILHYRLYDLDRIVSRTLTYSLLTGTLAVVWAAVAFAPMLVLGTGEVSNALVAVATMATMAVVHPFRRRIQEVIDRRLYRRRYDARRAVERLGMDLADEVDLQALEQRVTATLAATIGPRTVSVWRRGRRREVADA